MEANKKPPGEKIPVIPLFLLKLMALLEVPENYKYIKWSDDGKSFVVLDQVGFSKFILPQYFKHNKFSSFVRQLNLYGFRKVTPLEHGLVQHEEKVEFRHPFFIKGKANLLHMIKRKVSLPGNKQSEAITAVLEEITEIKDNQVAITEALSDIKQENEVLWSEVVSLRQKHAQQQKVVNHLIKFLVTLVQHHGMGRKRRLPLAWKGDDAESSNIKVSKPTFHSSASASNVEVPDIINPLQSLDNGPLITELLSTSTSPAASVLETSQVTEKQPSDSTNNDDETFDISQLIGLDDSSNRNELSEAVSSSQIVSSLADNQSEVEPSIFLNLPSSNESASSSSPLNIPSYQSALSPMSGAVATSSSKALQRTNSVHDLNSNMDMIQKNLQSIQERLTDNNDQYQLDYDLIQDLFNGQAVLPSQNDWVSDLPKTIPLSNAENNQLMVYTGNGDNPFLQEDNANDEEKQTEYNDLSALLG